MNAMWLVSIAIAVGTFVFGFAAEVFLRTDSVVIAFLPHLIYYLLVGLLVVFFASIPFAYLVGGKR